MVQWINLPSIARIFLDSETKFSKSYHFEKNEVRRSDMLNSYTHKNKYLNLSTSSVFPPQSDFEKRLHQILRNFFCGPMNNSSVRSPKIFGFWGKNFQNPIILRITKLDAQICRVPLTCVWLYSCTDKSLPAASWAVNNNNNTESSWWGRGVDITVRM